MLYGQAGAGSLAYVEYALAGAVVDNPVVGEQDALGCQSVVVIPDTLGVAVEDAVLHGHGIGGGSGSHVEGIAVCAVAYEVYVVEHELSEVITVNCHVTFHLHIAISGKTHILDDGYLLVEDILSCLEDEVCLARGNGSAEFGSVLHRETAAAGTLVVGRIPARVSHALAHRDTADEGVVAACSILDRIGGEHDTVSFGSYLTGDYA